MRARWTAASNRAKELLEKLIVSGLSSFRINRALTKIVADALDMLSELRCNGGI
jgi:hypothetical protein